MKKTFCIISLLFILLMLSACGGPIYGLSGGTYAVQNDGTVFSPSIFFDLTNYRFSFSYDPLSSYCTTGTFDIENGRVIAVTDDDQYTYIFEIIDNDIITFVANASDAVVVIDSVISMDIVDGTEFIYADER